MTLTEYLESLAGKQVDVVGAGISNRPLVRLLADAGIPTTVHDRASAEALGTFFYDMTALGVSFSLGDGYMDELAGDIIFRTPGLHPSHPTLQKARERGAVVTSEMEIFLRLCPCPVFAVTGSDGKTTVTTILSELLKAGGYKVWLGGNIGHPLLAEVDGITKEDVAVLELSSFQLHSMECHPQVAVITNLSPNHLDVHPDYKDYIDAKRQIYLHQNPAGRLVLNRDNGDTAACAADAPGQVVWFSRNRPEPEGAYFRADGMICVSGEPVVNASELLVPGIHNVENMMTAFAAAEGYVSHEVMRQTARTFRGVPHRLQTVGIHRGVTYINDSIASSPKRTAAGLSCFDKKLILIAGGKDKGLSFDELGSSVCAHVKALFLTGMTAEAIRNAVMSCPEYEPGKPEITVIDDFQQTVLAAAARAQEGDTVLLSPASTSFDRFKNFEERGNKFIEITEGLD